MKLSVKHLGRVAYLPTYRSMTAHIETLASALSENTPDEAWVVEHDPVFTLGKAGKQEHILDAGSIPVVATDRGGQVTYHGPGQLVVYTLFNLKRLGLGPKALVSGLEQAIIDTLVGYGISGERRKGAPGIYVEGAKIAALGLRIRQGISYHGIALNVDMDLSPFSRINPCGYAGLAVTQLADLGISATLAEVADIFTPALAKAFGQPLAMRATQTEFETSI